MVRVITTSAVLIAMASPALAELSIEAGPNFVKEQYTDSQSLVILKHWQNKYALGLGYMSSHCIDNEVIDLDCEWHVSQQLMIGAERRFGWRRWNLNIGLYYVDDTSRISSTHLNIRTSLAYSISERFAVKLSHLSNGGLGPETTECNVNGTCVTGDFNLGINTLALVWRF